MKFETLNYIYNLLTKEVDTTRTLQQHTFKILCEAEQTENDEEIEKANEDNQYMLRKYHEALDALTEFKNKDWN